MRKVSFSVVLVADLKTPVALRSLPAKGHATCLGNSFEAIQAARATRPRLLGASALPQHSTYSKIRGPRCHDVHVAMERARFRNPGSDLGSALPGYGQASDLAASGLTTWICHFLESVERTEGLCFQEPVPDLGLPETPSSACRPRIANSNSDVELNVSLILWQVASASVTSSSGQEQFRRSLPQQLNTARTLRSPKAGNCFNLE